MSDLTDRIRVDLTAAMKAHDELSTATLRMALTALQTEQVAGTAARSLSDADELAVLAREAKRRREAATAFDDAHRPELAERERAEGTVLARYLPEPLGEDELTALITDAIADLGVSGPAAMGAVMKVLTPAVRGRADGKQVAALVRTQLGAG